MTTPFPFADGQVLLRRDSKKGEPIGAATGGEHSHAGICGDASRSVAIDAYPGRGQYAVAELPLVEFFDPAHAPAGGSVFRYKYDDAGQAAEAAKYARSMTLAPHTFEIEDPIVGADGGINDNTAVYCSEFVWRCYHYAADVRLVEPDDFFDLWEHENLTRAAHAFLPAHLVQQYGRWARLLGVVARQSPKTVSKAVDQLEHLLVSRGHNGLFITPQQLASSSLLEYVGSRP